MKRMTRERFLTDQELERLMRVVRERRHVNQPRDHALLALLANTGMRPSEALALRRCDLHLQAPAPWVRVNRLKKRKALGEFDELPITAELAGILSVYCGGLPDDADTALFPIQRRQVQRMFAHCRRRAGIAARHPLYVLRHTAATRLYCHTRDISLVQAVLGHEKADTTTIYAHIPRSMLEDLAARMPAFV
jgi:integrase